MSYIIQQNQPLLNFKLTESGREKIAQGKLTFKYWAIGDSEVNYERETLNKELEFNQLPIDLSNIINSVDRQPNIKHFITGLNSVDNLNVLSENNIRTLKYVVNNRAKTRGFFNLVNGELTQKLDLDTTLLSTQILLDGSNTITLSDIGDIQVDDYILLKNDSLSSSKPSLHFWYKIIDIINNDLVIDRNLPNTGLNGTIFIYKGGEVSSSFGNDNSSHYWNEDTLNFNSSCDVTTSDVPVWNMNNVWDENLIGVSGNTLEKYEDYGSFDYVGTKYPFLGYITDNPPMEKVKCDTTAILDTIKKGISIIHYTNNTISNFYGEFLFVDEKTNKRLEINLPTIMYHRKKLDNGVTTTGMSFVSDFNKNVIDNTNIEFYNLIENPNLVEGEPKIVGRVFPQYKFIIIDDEEILATMSYLSNRNFTLPNLDLNLVNSSDGILLPNKSMYVTYMLHNDDSLNILNGTLPNQNYIKVTNTTSISKDVDILLEDMGLLNYMTKLEETNDLSQRFYVNKIKVLYQIVDDIDDRPNNENWIEVDLTSNLITENDGETINPNLLENRNPNVTGLKLNKLTVSDSKKFNLSNYLNLPLTVDPNNLQFGDERFFYGNIDTFIGATVFKTLFDFTISASDFTQTSNPTKPINSDINIMLSELAIYDNDKDLIGIAKLSQPIEISNGNTITLEASIDF